MYQGSIVKGSVDKSVRVQIVDSTDGTPETGVVFNTSGIDLWYRRQGAAVVSITEASLATLATAHTDGGFLHISHGLYRLDLPDAAFATGADYVEFGGTVTGMIVIPGVIQLTEPTPFQRGVARPNFAFQMLLSATDLPATGKTVAVAYAHDGSSTYTSIGNATEMANGAYEIDLSSTVMNASSINLRMTNVDCHERNVTIFTDA
jgi:hypothetical protein